MKQILKVTKYAIYKGIFQKKIGFWQAVALVVSSTIGAGIIGVPYVVAQVGFPIGLLYIIGVGILMTYMNLLIGEVVARSKDSFQLIGLARKYIGIKGQIAMTVLMYVIIVGALAIYIIGIGNGLAALFQGTSFMWSFIFFIICAPLIFIGIDTIKKAELFLTLVIIFVVIIIVAISAPHIITTNLITIPSANLLLPYGIILFAFHSSVSIPEAYTLIKYPRDFRNVISTASVISIIIYILFTLAVVGVTGSSTTQVATIGLGEALGRSAFLFTNIFALVAMGTSFLILGLSLRNSIHWDFKIRPWLASTITLGVPFIIFVLGLREFINAIEIVGGVFITLELLLMILIYWRAQHKDTHELSPTEQVVRHTHLFLVILLIALIIGIIYTVINLF